MKEFVGPYTQTTFLARNHNIFERKVLNRKNSFLIWKQNNFWRAATNRSFFETKEAAMEALDAVIIERGYTILTQEQWNKYSILL
jgi:hypothetical protein